ncbi:hypothetical protein AAA435_12355 [Lactobacillus crispatus]|uniref:hypothetical protein n=1 Tax=Lactobacillus crispatus TaxID=47770 RepID=UPI0030FB98AD
MIKNSVFSFESDVRYVVNYLPTKRCRKTRSVDMYACHKFYVKNIASDEAPIAFKVTNCGETIIRLFNGTLFNPANAEPWLYNQHKNMEDQLKYIASNNEIEQVLYADHPYDMFKSRVISDDFDKRCHDIQENLDKRCLIIDGKLWLSCSEPRYEVATLGLGHNYGGTFVMISYDYNSNTSKNNYFRADQFDEAVKYAIKVAENRGDTNNLAELKQALKTKKYSWYIDVLIPEAVKCNPKVEAGDGDPFLNEMEEIIEASPDKETAGLSVMLSALSKRK